jgi:hypothetical protein
MAINENHDNHYRVDYTYGYYDKARRCWYEDTYNSKPFATEAEARAYADRVIQRAAAKPHVIELDNLTIIYVDQEYWNECGDVRIVQHFDF